MASSGKKKQRRTLLVLTGCIIVFAGAYAGISVYQNKQEAAKEAENQTEKIHLFDIGKDDLTEISYQREGNEISLIKKKGNWLYKEDESFPLVQDTAGNMAKVASGLSALRLIADDPDDMAEYGLDDPAIVITFRSKDQNYTLSLGDQSPSSDSGYYCRVDDETKVYEIASDVYSNFDYALSKLMKLEDAPVIVANQITELDIKKTKKDRFHVMLSNISDSSSWGIKKPYAMEVPGDNSELSTFLSSYESIAYEGAVEYNCKDFSKYGLLEKKPGTASVMMKYYELKEEETQEDDSNKDSDKEDEKTKVQIDHRLNLLIGDQDKNGNYYVRVNGSSYVYLMTKDAVEKLLPDDTYTYINKTIAKVSMGNLETLTAVAGDRKYEMYSKEKTVKNDDEEEETQTDYFFNKKTMTLEDFNAVGATWNLIETAKEIPKKDKKSLNLKDIVLTVHVKGGRLEQEVSFVTFDQNYCAVLENGSVEFLTDKRAVDKLINKLAEMENK